MWLHVVQDVDVRRGWTAIVWQIVTVVVRYRGVLCLGELLRLLLLLGCIAVVVLSLVLLVGELGVVRDLILREIIHDSLLLEHLLLLQGCVVHACLF